MNFGQFACATILASALFACTSQNDGVMNDLIEHPLDYDGKVIEMTIYPVDDGEQSQYRFCSEPCSVEEDHFNNRLGIGYWPCCFIQPRWSGEYKGWVGNRHIRVRAKFDAHCFRPKAICADAAEYWFYEVK